MLFDHPGSLAAIYASSNVANGAEHRTLDRLASRQPTPVAPSRPPLSQHPRFVSGNGPCPSLHQPRHRHATPTNLASVTATNQPVESLVHTFPCQHIGRAFQHLEQRFSARRPWARNGRLMGTARRKCKSAALVGPLSWCFLERMTRFELATLTLAKVRLTVRAVRLLLRSTPQSTNRPGNPSGPSRSYTGLPSRCPGPLRRDPADQFDSNAAKPWGDG